MDYFIFLVVFIIVVIAVVYSIVFFSMLFLFHLFQMFNVVKTDKCVDIFSGAVTDNCLFYVLFGSLEVYCTTSSFRVCLEF